MKIQKLQFQNINSLKGEWEIDFTNPAFESEGIFAITGPTGSGKSTILDAISLALYGSTPRLGTLTQSNNELMTRGTGVCYAKVQFIVGNDCYIAEWHQHRARKQPDGALQGYRSELSKWDDEKKEFQILAKNSEMAKLLPKIIQMDYSQFTRSMLLAQGSFAAFLNSSSQERADTLEKITGTDIYTTISEKVFARRKHEKEKLDLLDVQLKAMRPLSEQERQSKETESKNICAELEELNESKRKIDAAKRWLEQMASLSSQLCKEKVELEKINLKKPVIDEIRHQIDRSDRANQLNEIYRVYKLTLDQEESLVKRIEELKNNRLPKEEITLQEAVSDYVDKKNSLDSAKNAKNTLLPILAEVRLKDQKINIDSRALDELSHKVTALVNKKDLLATSLQTQKKEFEEKGNQGLSLKTWLNEHQSFNFGADVRDSLMSLNSQFAISSNEVNNKRKNLQEQEVARGNAKNAVLNFEPKVKEARYFWDQARQTFEKKNEELKAILDDQTPIVWSNKAENERNSVDFFKGIQLLAKEISADLESQQKYVKLRDDFDKTLIEKTNEIEETEKRIKSLRNQERDLEKLVVSLDFIAQLDSARRELIEGEPCPLCGAKVHPWSTQDVPSEDGEIERLAQTKAELSSLNEEVLRLMGEKNALETNRNFNKVQAESFGSNAQAKEETLRKKLANFELPECLDDLQAWIDTRLAETQLAYDSLRHKVNAINLLNTEVEDKRQTADSKKTEYDKLNVALGKLQADVTFQDRVYQDTQKVFDEAFALNKANLQKLTDAVSEHYELVNNNEASIIEGFNQIINLNDEHNAKSKTFSDLMPEMSKLEALIGENESKFREVSGEYDEQNQKFVIEGKNLKALRAERFNLFADKDPNAEERKANNAQTQAEAQYQEANEKRSEAEKALNKIKGEIETLDKEKVSKQSELSVARSNWESALSASEFNDTETWMDAKLTDEALKQAKKQVNGFNEDKTRSEERVRGLEKQLQEESLKALTNKSLDDTKAELEGILSKIEVQLQQQGALREALEADDQKRAQCTSMMAEICKQRAIFQDWDRLNTLIGSSNGQNYRSYVQGLTFEVLVRYANASLRLMTDRYELIRNKTEPLMLDVRDHYNAGIVRTTKNLSGGESFIVSLALALGLSNMTSHKIKIDSLFLDEGFGTLDEDALDHALNVLSSLKHSHGKMIGIISHVGQIKERISAKIQVTPKLGGTSTLSGDGVIAKRITLA